MTGGLSTRVIELQFIGLIAIDGIRAETDDWTSIVAVVNDIILQRQTLSDIILILRILFKEI